MKIMKKITATICLVLAMTLVVPSYLPNAVGQIATVEAASKVKLNKSKATLIKGQTLQLKVTGTSETIKWSTSKKSVATVTSKGKVTAKKKGTAIITAKVGSKKYKCNITVETPKLNKTAISVVVGNTYKLKLAGTSQKIKWSSSNKKIATVTSKGVIKAVKKGTAIITAKVGSKKYKCKITVETPKLNKTAISVVVGNTYKLKLAGTSQKIKWSSSNKKIATVTSKGVVKGVKKGNATITAKTGGKSYKCKVTVKKAVNLKSISLNKSSVTLTLDEMDAYQLKVKYNPSNTTVDKTVKWTSSDEDVVEVDEDGYLYAYTSGKATITAKVGNRKATCKVTVKCNVEEIELDKTSLELDVGETETIKATVYPDDATDKTVKWTSSNNSVATVSSMGVVSAKGAGTAIITASVGNVSTTCEVEVKKLLIEGMPDDAISANIEINDNSTEFYVTITNNTDEQMIIPYGEGILANNKIYVDKLRSGERSLYGDDDDSDAWDVDFILNPNETKIIKLNAGYYDYYETYTYSYYSEILFAIMYKDTEYCVGVSYYGDVNYYTTKQNEAEYEKKLVGYGIAAIKEALKNPSSFTIQRMGKKYNNGVLSEVKIEYSASNSYGAMKTGYVAVEINNQTTDLYSSGRSILTKEIGIVELYFMDGTANFLGYTMVSDYGELNSYGNSLYMQQQYWKLVY